MDDGAATAELVDSGKILDPEKSDKRAKRDSLDMLTEASAAADVVCRNGTCSGLVSIVTG